MKSDDELMTQLPGVGEDEECVTSIEEGQEVACPTCDSVIVTINEGCVLPPCEHTRFVFNNGEAFEYAEPGLQAWLQEQEERADEDEDAEEYDVWNALLTYVKPDGIVLERVDRFMACGPTKLTIWVGVRHRPSKARRKLQ